MLEILRLRGDGPRDVAGREAQGDGCARHQGGCNRYDDFVQILFVHNGKFFQYVKDRFWNSAAKIRVIFDMRKKIPDQFIFGRGDFYICRKRGKGIG